MSEPRIEPVIAIEHVGKRFGRLRALDDVSVSIGAGERVAFVGTNGSGKTTLLRALLGLVRVDGAVKIDGIDVARSPERALRDVAYIPQIAPPLESPTGEVVRAFAQLRGLEVAAIAERARDFGVALDGIGRSRFRDLSGGTKQKVLAAMALATRCRVLVCDEPTANLDAAARRTFFALVDQRPEGSILVLCSHRIEEVRRLVDRVVELRDGRLAADLRLDELLARRRTSRVEVLLADGAAEAAALLRDLGFRPTGPRQFGATLGQRERIEVVNRLLREHAADVRDLTLVEDDEPAAAPRLQVVP